MKKTLILSVFLIGSSMFANTTASAVSENKVIKNNITKSELDAYKLYKCMITKMTPKEKTDIRKSAIVWKIYADKGMNGFLGVNKKLMEKYANRTGYIAMDLIVNRCRKETLQMFKDSTMKEADNNLFAVSKMMMRYVTSDPSVKDSNKMKEIFQGIINGMKKVKGSDEFFDKIEKEKKQEESLKK